MTFTFKLAKRIAHSRPVALRALAAVLLLAGCADAVGTGPTDTPSLDTAPAVAVATITITPGTASGAIGDAAQFTAVLRDAQGRVLTGRTVSWRTTNSAVVTVTPSGYATAIGGGSALIEAKASGVTGRATVTVSGPTISVATVTVTPGTISGAIGESAQFTATVADAAGNTLPTVGVTWASTNAAVVTVTPHGYATAIGGGTAEVIATAGGKSGRATVTVTGAPVPTVASITVTPGSASGSVGEAAQFSATVRDAAGNVLTGQSVTWSSTNTTVVAVTAGGYATAVGGGSAAIVATAGGISGEAPVTVTGGTPPPPPASVASVTLSPTSVSTAVGGTAQLTAVVRDAAGTVLSGQTVTWSSNTGSVATVSGSGMVTGLTGGSTTITASAGGRSGTATVNVSGSTQPPVSGNEPTYQSGQTLIWKDTFDGLLSDASLLVNYAVLNGQFIHADRLAGLGGSGAARIDWPAQTGCQDDSRVLERSMSPTREVIVTYSVRYTAGFQFDWRNASGCSGNAKKLFFLYAVSGSRFDFISENHFLGMGSDYDHPLFAQNLNSTMSVEQLGDGNWHRITIHVRQSSTPDATDGFIRGWIDGVQRWSHENVASRASGGWNYFRLPATFNQGSPVSQTEWIDDLVVWRP